MKFLGDEFDFNQATSKQIVIDFGTTPPIDPIGGQLWYNTNSGWDILMYWDSNRTSWLSMETLHYMYGRAAKNTGSQYLRIIESSSSDVITPIIRRDFTIIGMTSGTNAASTATYAARTKDVTTGALSANLVTLTQTNSRYAVSNGLNYQLKTPIGLAAYVTGTGINNPSVTILIKYRWAIA